MYIPPDRASIADHATSSLSVRPPGRSVGRRRGAAGQDVAGHGRRHRGRQQGERGKEAGAVGRSGEEGQDAGGETRRLFKAPLGEQEVGYVL